jgi:hypothetical protein
MSDEGAEGVLRDYIENDTTGWTQDTVLGLVADFIDEKGLTAELEEFLEKKQNEELEESEAESDDEDA